MVYESSLFLFCGRANGRDAHDPLWVALQVKNGIIHLLYEHGGDCDAVDHGRMSTLITFFCKPGLRVWARKRCRILHRGCSIPMFMLM